ncbi:hypothetical protein [Geodermatophilus obscurus]|nr:hypothetical protein [Geodermatophilus obscurus]
MGYDDIDVAAACRPRQELGRQAAERRDGSSTVRRDVAADREGAA